MNEMILLLLLTDFLLKNSYHKMEESEWVLLQSLSFELKKKYGLLIVIPFPIAEYEWKPKSWLSGKYYIT